jgi:hypothetical protein
MKPYRSTLADPRGLWLNLARMYDRESQHAANMHNEKKEEAYRARAEAARQKAETYS